MRLSEAIREGAKKRPQVFDEYFDGRVGCVGSCAAGAAIEAVTGKPEYDSAAFLALGLGKSVRVACPACARVHFTLDSAITHLNDDHRWAREAIADWVETVENATPESPK